MIRAVLGPRSVEVAGDVTLESTRHRRGSHPRSNRAALGCDTLNILKTGVHQTLNHDLPISASPFTHRSQLLAVLPNQRVRYYLGTDTQVDYGRALELFQRVAYQGFAAAQFNLGLMYEHGQGTEVDNMKCYEWYYRAAEQGYEDAQFNLANMYYSGVASMCETGEGTPNYEKAIEWHQRAAFMGHASAQYNLGLMFYKGEGCKASIAKAVEMFSLAAEQGHESAKNILDKNLI